MFVFGKHKIIHFYNTLYKNISTKLSCLVDMEQRSNIFCFLCSVAQSYGVKKLYVTKKIFLSILGQRKKEKCV